MKITFFVQTKNLPCVLRQRAGGPKGKCRREGGRSSGYPFSRGGPARRRWGAEQRTVFGVMDAEASSQEWKGGGLAVTWSRRQPEHGVRPLCGLTNCEATNGSAESFGLSGWATKLCGVGEVESLGCGAELLAACCIRSAQSPFARHGGEHPTSLEKDGQFDVGVSPTKMYHFRL